MTARVNPKDVAFPDLDLTAGRHDGESLLDTVLQHRAVRAVQPWSAQALVGPAPTP